MQIRGGSGPLLRLLPYMDPQPQPAVGLPATPARSHDASADIRLAAAVLRRDRKAAAQFVSDHADSIYAYVKHRLAPRVDLVDDVVQDVFTAAIAGLQHFKGTSSLRAWLLGIARHKIEDYYRERLREPEALDDDAPEPPAAAPPLEETLDRDRARARAREVLQQLPEEYAVVVLWRYWEGRSVRQIAAATGRTEKGVERLLERLAVADSERSPERAPARLKSKIYSAVIQRLSESGPLLDLRTSKAEGTVLCVFEETLTPFGSAVASMNPCRVCHARLLGEHLDRAPIFWPHCPYADFHRGKA